MKDLITKGVSLHCKSGFDSDLVYLIAKKGNIRILEYLIHKNAAFDVPQTDSLLTPLLVAAHQGHLDCVKFLVKKGAKVNRVSRQGMSALYLAGKQKHYRIVKYLCSILGVIEFMESSSEKNTFMYGIVNKDTELVKILLEKEAAANIVGGWESEGEYPLHIAVRHNSEHLVQLLCSYSDSDIDIESPSDYLTPFMSAVLLHHFGVADILLQMGADPSHEGDQGCTLSQLGENKKNYLALKYLRERGIMGGMGGHGEIEEKGVRIAARCRWTGSSQEQTHLPQTHTPYEALSPSAARSQNPKTPKPQNPKTPKPQNPKTPKPQNPKTPKPQNPKTPKPQNPKTPKPPVLYSIINETNY